MHLIGRDDDAAAMGRFIDEQAFARLRNAGRLDAVTGNDHGWIWRTRRRAGAAYGVGKMSDSRDHEAIKERLTKSFPSSSRGAASAEAIQRCSTPRPQRDLAMTKPVQRRQMAGFQIGREHVRT